MPSRLKTLRLLLWLKWTLTWRGYLRNRMKVAGTVITVLAFLPISLGAAWMVHYLGSVEPDYARLIVRAALTIIYLLWATSPLFGFQVNESYDITKLFCYPISYSRLFAGLTIGGLIDVPVLLVLPTLVVLVTLFSYSWLSVILNSGILLLFMLHTLSMSQGIMISLLGLLRSRRFRDLTIVLFPLVGMIYYIGQRSLAMQMVRTSPTALLSGPVWHIIDLLPPGYASLGMSFVRSGNVTSGLLQIGLLSAACLLSVSLASSTLKSLYLGDRGDQISIKHSQTTVYKSGISHARPKVFAILRLIPAEIIAVAGKELRYFRREPLYKAMAMQSLYMMVAIAAPFILPISGHASVLPDGISAKWIVFGAGSAFLLAALPLPFNMWGGEGAAITMLFSTPVSRRWMILGKNIAHALVLFAQSILGIAIAALFTNNWSITPLAILMTGLALPVLLAAGNLISVRFPHRLVVRGQRWAKGGMSLSSSDVGGGCAYAAIYGFTFLVTLIVVLPTFAAILVPYLLDLSPTWYALTIPLAAAYGVTLYLALLGPAEQWLMDREPEIAGKIVPVD